MSREVLIRRLQPYLLLALFALPAIWPFIHPGLPRSNDHLPHLYRVVELDRLVRAGVLFPRWAPDLVHGYGYPVFNFFPYLGHYLAEGFHLLGLGFLAAFKAAFVLTLLCTAWFAYRLGHEHFGEAAGLVTGVAYLYSPYILYDAHIRGSLPESLALAILPLAMLHLRRAAHGPLASSGPAWRSAVWAGLSIAAFLLAHNGVSLQAMPFLIAYGFFEAVMHHKDRERIFGIGNWKLGFGIFSFVTLPFVLACLLSAFFWLPALAEARFAQIERGTLNGAMSYVNNFLSLSELTALPRLPVDPDLLNPPVVHPLPLAALVIAGLGLFRWRTLTRSHTYTLIFLWFLSLTATLLIIPPARLLWDTLPLLRLTLFPWRLLGPISLFVALLAGALFADYSPSANSGWVMGHGSFDIRHFFLSLVLCALIVSGLPFASPPFESAPAAPTLADVAAFEIPPDFIGTTTVGEYLPVWVKQLPDTKSNREKLMKGEAIERFDAPGADVQHVDARALGDTFTLTTPQPFTFVYRTFYFPGWRAMLDGQPAPIRITGPEGLMAVDAPAGSHTLTFQFGSTPPRTIGTALSILGLLACLSLIALHRAPLELGDQGLVSGNWHLGFTNYYLLFTFALLLALARPLVYDAGYTPLLRHGLQPEGLPSAAHPLNQDFVGEMTLLGWDAKRESGGADDPFTVNLYWKANHRLGVAYGFDVRLVDAEGLTWSEPDPPHTRDWRFTPGTDFWPEDQYVMDSYVLTPLAGTPPSEYTVQVNVFARYNLQSIGTAQLRAITINVPSRKRLCRDPGERGFNSLAQTLVMQAATFSPIQATPGDEIVASLCWSTVSSLSTDLRGELLLQDSQGNTPVTQPFTIGGRYPTTRWNATDTILDQLKTLLPAALETGDYQWLFRVGGNSLTIGVLHITAPPRTFAAPPVAQTLTANLGLVTLCGVSVSPESAAPGTVVTATIVWEGNREMATSYHVFAHLLGPDGTLVTQSDGVPADWTRRTTGWLPGEFVTDTRTLTLPADASPGDYTLWAGMYDPATGERLTTGEFPDGRVRLGRVHVGP